MVAQIVLGSPLAQHITPKPTWIFRFSPFFKFQSLVMISHPLIQDFKTNLKPFYDNYL